MKKLVLWFVIMLISVSMLFTFSLASCKQKAAEEVVKEEEVAEEEAGEEMAKEVSGGPDIYEQYTKYIYDTETLGPNGEKPTWFSEVTLTAEEIEQIRAGNYKVVYLEEETSMFSRANVLGTEDACTYLNMELIATVDDEMDPAKQKTDVETVLALNPDIIIALTIDPVQGAEAFRPAVEAGVSLVFMSNVPQGYVQGEDYVGMVTDDLFGMGKAAAEMLADALGGEGEVGWIYHDADFYVTNQRDNGFKNFIEENYPNIEIIDEKGMATIPDAEIIASAMITQHPDISGIYTPWDTPGEGAVAACRAAGRQDIKVVTLDLGANNALDMAQGGNIVGISADLAYLLGYTKVIMGAYGLLNKEAPSFVIVPAIKVAKDNLIEGWRESLHQDPPKEVMEALGE